MRENEKIVTFSLSENLVSVRYEEKAGEKKERRGEQRGSKEGRPQELGLRYLSGRPTLPIRIGLIPTDLNSEHYWSNSILHLVFLERREEFFILFSRMNKDLADNCLACLDDFLDLLFSRRLRIIQGDNLFKTGQRS